MELVEQPGVIPRDSEYFCTVSDRTNLPIPPTEQDGPIGALETLSIAELASAMHDHSQQATRAVGQCLPHITAFLEALVPRMREGGRLIYIGAGTSGRLGVVDASECPPTFGVAPEIVQGWIAGGDGAMRVAVEGAEDDATGAWNDLAAIAPTAIDTVVGIAASGRTPYVVGGLKAARAAGLLTACITCNPNSAAAAVSDHAIEAITGGEFITGSTRLNAGTATKLVLNLISTIAMVQLGHVQGSKMIDMRPSNAKLIERGIRMIVEATGASDGAAAEALAMTGSVRKSIAKIQGNAHA